MPPEVVAGGLAVVAGGAGGGCGGCVVGAGAGEEDGEGDGGGAVLAVPAGGVAEAAAGVPAAEGFCPGGDGFVALGLAWPAGGGGAGLFVAALGPVAVPDDDAPAGDEVGVRGCPGSAPATTEASHATAPVAATVVIEVRFLRRL